MRAYATPFAVFQVYLDWYGFADECIRAVEPAYKTGGLAALCRDALFMVYNWT
jgi:hypothetical protein